MIHLKKILATLVLFSALCTSSYALTYIGTYSNGSKTDAHSTNAIDSGFNSWLLGLTPAISITSFQKEVSNNLGLSGTTGSITATTWSDVYNTATPDYIFFKAANSVLVYEWCVGPFNFGTNAEGFGNGISHIDVGWTDRSVPDSGSSLILLGLGLGLLGFLKRRK